MSWRVTGFFNLWNFYRISFLKKSIFYRLSLDKRHSIFDVNKFISDPWGGDQHIGRNILGGNFIPEDETIALRIMDSFSVKNSPHAKHVAGFSWIRDLQAVGGNSSRKYVRNLISTFITSYRKKRNFWLDTDYWDNAVVGERITNWIFSYSFFATGADDRFQRLVLSSISEQFSHLLKSYKAEFNPYSRIITLKAIIFCLAASKVDQSRHIKKFIRLVCRTVDDCINENGMVFWRSAIDQFHIFRSLLEMRFVLKDSGIELPKEIFVDKIALMAANLRQLRLGDGRLSRHAGDFNMKNSVFYPTQHIVDSALSFVDTKNYNVKVFGFERIATKDSVLLINTKPGNLRSEFNHHLEPGINILDFEASFGGDRLINRADISVAYDGLRIKLDNRSRSFIKKMTSSDALLFEGEVQFFNKFFKFAMRRELSISLTSPKISGTDFVLMSGMSDVFLRFVFCGNALINEVNKKMATIAVEKSEYTFEVLSEEFGNIEIIRDAAYPSIEVMATTAKDNELEFKWSVERV